VREGESWNEGERKIEREREKEGEGRGGGKQEIDTVRGI
jgi:hypothetical protein